MLNLFISYFFSSWYDLDPLVYSHSELTLKT